MVPETAALSNHPVTSAQAGPFEDLKKQVRSSLLLSGALLTEDKHQGGTYEFKGAKVRWEVREPEIIVIEQFEDEKMLPLSSGGGSSGTFAAAGGAPEMPSVNEQSAETYPLSTSDTVFSPEALAGGVSVVEDVTPQLHDSWLLAAVERAFSEKEGSQGLGVLGNSLLERLQDEAVSSGTSGIGTPSSGESEPEMEAPSNAPGRFYRTQSVRPPAGIRRASAPSISVSAQLRSAIVEDGSRLGEVVLDERIASGASASSSGDGLERVAPWRPNFMGRPPRPSSATVFRSQSLRVLSDTSSDSGRNSPNPETFGGFEELREVSLSPDVPSSPTPASYVPSIRSGAASSIGPRSQMEDAHLTLDDISELLSDPLKGSSPSAFFGVFDGHGGRDAAEYAGKHLLDHLLADALFPVDVHRALVRSFLETDEAFHNACLAEKVEHSGTTALTALIVGRMLVVANAGDCRAVLCQKGKTVEMSRDQKPACEIERRRIVARGGFVEDGYLNGQLGVARALGNWHMEDFKAKGHLTAEPEVKMWELGHEDEFMIMGCDGLWDVISSRMAVDLARKRLQQHNDPTRCSQELVEEALKRQTSDNVTVVTVCFQKEAPPRLSTAAPVGVRRSISVDSLRALQEKLDTC